MAHTTDQRIRGRQLQRIRTAHLSRFPLCVECEKTGKTTIATQLDHVIALANGGTDTQDPFENRQGLCSECHAKKTAVDLGYIDRPRIGLDGYPIT